MGESFSEILPIRLAPASGSVNVLLKARGAPATLIASINAVDIGRSQNMLGTLASVVLARRDAGPARWRSMVAHRCTTSRHPSLSQPLKSIEFFELHLLVASSSAFASKV